MLRAAVIGLGVIAPVHLQFIREREGVTLAAACDIRAERAAVLPEGVPFYEEYETLLDEAKPDVVHLCLPHYLHSIVAEAALKRGIAVFTEKPMASTYEGAKKMCEMDEKYDALLGICLQNRLNPVNQKLLALCRSGEYGEVRGVKGRVDWFRPQAYYLAEPWRGKKKEAGSGCILNQAIHTLDLMTLIKPDIPDYVSGAMLRLSDYPIEVEDTATAHIVYEDGCCSYFSATVLNHSNEDVELTVLLDKGMLIVRGNSLYFSGGGQTTLLHRDDPCQGEKAYYGSSHGQCMENFYRSLENGEDLYIHAKDALPAMKIYEAIRRSSAAGGKSISMETIS